jgi:hypothetical protein
MVRKIHVYKRKVIKIPTGLFGIRYFWTIKDRN